MSSFTKRNSIRDHFLYPANQQEVKINPPYFTWPKNESNCPIKFELKSQNNKVIHDEVTQDNLIELQKSLAPGNYSWSLSTKGNKRHTFRFFIGSNTTSFQPIRADELIAKISSQHPKHLWDYKYRKAILQENGINLKYLRNNLKQALKDGAPNHPAYYKIIDPKVRSNESTIFFKRFRQLCDRNMISAAFAWYLWKSPEAKIVLRDFFETVLNWNPEGVCAVDGPWGDEIGLSLARCLPIAYDLTYDLWSEKETIWIKNTLYIYAKQTYRRLMNTTYIQTPGNSHVGRLPGYLGDFAIVLKDFVPIRETKEWLDVSLKIFNTFYPFYGEDDGGWSQGSFYASTYLKWHLPFFLVVEKLVGRSFFEKSFHKNYILYLSHFLNPKNEIHPFGDGYWSYDIKQEWPGFFAENPMKIYQEKFGNNQTKIISDLAPKRQLMELHVFDEMVPVKKIRRSRQAIKKLNNDHCFLETGLISMHSSLLDHKNDIAAYMRCSKFGAGSHQHADQGNFAILSKGKALISPSGFFGLHYGDFHHTEWTQTTQAHNLYLIDETGQPFNSPQTMGEILSFSSQKEFCCASLDLKSAYPMTRTATRHFTFLKTGFILVIDHIELKKESTIQWLLHSLVQPEITKNSIFIKRENCQLTGQFLTKEPERFMVTNQFNWLSKISSKIQNEKRTQYHSRWNFSSALKHHIVMLFSINQPKERFQIHDQVIHFETSNLTYSLHNGARIV